MANDGYKIPSANLHYSRYVDLDDVQITYDDLNPVGHARRPSFAVLFPEDLSMWDILGDIKLKPIDRLIMICIYENNLTQAETAAAVGRSQATVSSRHKKIIKRLRRGDDDYR